MNINSETRFNKKQNTTMSRPIVPARNYAAAVQNGGTYFMVRRIKAPCASDVLSGRGGSVNQHPGNIRFRLWVNERKYDYNLAPSKVEKAVICREVIAKVTAQDPPGRFLGREDNNSAWWIELDDERIMAKTSQALREGAPKIREEHKGEIEQIHKQRKPSRRSRSNVTSHQKKTASQTTETVQQPMIASTAVVPSLTTPNVQGTHHHRRTVEHSTIYSSVLPEDTLKMKNSVIENKGNKVLHPSGNHQLPTSKRLRIQYLGQEVRPNDVTPPLLPSAPANRNNSEMKALILPPQRQETTQSIDYCAREVKPDDGTPPLQPVPAGSFNDIVPLTLPQVQNDNHDKMNLKPITTGMKRCHSLALSEGEASLGEWLSEDFVNPFEEDDERNMISSKSTFSNTLNSPPPLPPRLGILRESSNSSNGDFAGLGALLRGQSSSTSGNNNASANSLSPDTPEENGVCSSLKSNSSFMNSTSRQIEIPPNFTDQQSLATDFSQGMESIYNALHHSNVCEEEDSFESSNRASLPLDECGEDAVDKGISLTRLFCWNNGTSGGVKNNNLKNHSRLHNRHTSNGLATPRVFDGRQ